MLKCSPFLKVFTLFLFNSQPKVQIKMFDELHKLCRQSSHNKNALVKIGLQDKMLQVIQKMCYSYKVPNNVQNRTYVEGLIVLICKTFEIGVKETQNQIYDIVYANQMHALTRKGKILSLNVSHLFI